MKRGTFVTYSVPIVAADLALGLYANKLDNLIITNNAFSVLIGMSSIITILSSSAVHNRIEEGFSKWLFIISYILMTIAMILSILITNTSTLLILISNTVVVAANFGRYMNFKIKQGWIS